MIPYVATTFPVKQHKQWNLAKWYMFPMFAAIFNSKTYFEYFYQIIELQLEHIVPYQDTMHIDTRSR